MSRLGLESCLLLGAALLAACRDRNTPTAPSARPLMAATSVDQPYTWSITCSGDGASDAHWDWAAAGVLLASVSTPPCYPWSSPISGSATRPAAADSLRACVSQAFSGTCKSWTFDPASVFKAQLKGTSTWYEPCFPVGSRRCHSSKLTASATLDIADVR